VNPIVTLSDVSRVYPGGVTAVAGVSLSIGRGELVALTGPSGSGKSTLLQLMGALDRPTSGRIEFDGRDLSTLLDRSLSKTRAVEIGFVFQHFHLPVGVRVLDAVADGLLYAGVARRERLRRAHGALDHVGLLHRLRHRAHELSGGERQRVAIARALIGAPALLLADEPTGNLDSAAADMVIALLCELRSTGAAVVIVTHDADTASRMQRVVAMRDGRITRDTTQ
jgi:putative ABC transport system ATP-binding protein